MQLQYTHIDKNYSLHDKIYKSNGRWWPPFTDGVLCFTARPNGQCPQWV